MFSEKLRGMLDLAENIGRTPRIGKKELVCLLEKHVQGQSLVPEEAIALINSTLDKDNRKLLLGFSADYERPHDKEILLLPPLYFSSICENQCRYCDFSADGHRLSHETFRDEFDALANMGYRSIELVSSQDPELYEHGNGFTLDNQSFSIDGALEYFNIAKRSLSKNGGGMLTSNIPPLDTASMSRLRTTGLDCFLIWLECFDPTQYARLHIAEGPKANQAFRLDSFERASEAGIEHLAGAFLKGLHDWRKEEFLLYMLDRHLKAVRGRGFSIVGTPRLKGRFVESKFVGSNRVSEEDYELNVALDRILFDGILWLQTRESFSLNRRLINRYGGGVILTLSSCTAPGGYSKPPEARSQFPVYKQELSASTDALENDGFSVHFDWNSATLADFQRIH